MSSARRSIIYLANSEKIGGGNQVLMSLVSGVDQGRYRPVVVSPREGALTEWAASHSVPWSVLPFEGTSRLSLMTRVVRLARLFRRERAYLVHAQSPWSYRAAGLAARLTGVKGVCHVHFPIDADSLAWNVQFGVDAVVTCYNQLADDLSKGLPGRSYRLVGVRNTVDAQRFTPAGPADTEVMKQWRSGTDRIVVMVGHLSDVKGYPTFLEAVARLRLVAPKTRFLAVGGETLEPGYADKLKEQIERLNLGDVVEFLGWRSDVPEILRAADLMVLPSLAEGLPLAVLEAMASGCAVVASNVNGTPEAVVEGETGLLVNPNDPEALAERMLTILRDPELRRRMGIAGRARVERHFTMAQFLPRMQALYDELLAA